MSQDFMDRSTDDKQPRQRPEREKKQSYAASFGKTVLLYLHDIVYLLGIFLITLLVFFRIVIVSGPSMKNTLVDGDNLFIFSVPFLGEPEYGDIVIITKQSFRDGDPIVKRVIATENQWIDIQYASGQVYVGNDPDNMKLLDEEYIVGTTNPYTDFEFPMQIPEGCVFVMGDNRTNSTDSRKASIGLVDEREIIGRAFFLLVPGTEGGRVKRDFSRFGVLD